ncbi:TetR/AcrR family transcriptional regulator [Rhodoblastus acidophilus]|uniref:TetR/AcrR family transcriptional regulator n=1 Tax=Candidatus Rhodoblastus alkanivorans TaxID=2954117 RepID=A0ABS9Z935_9HYPH|nr:TetR/AcrR family transcriptional regulator [Candidatus Rhodoblastus alkanivorans]MCI4679272.1 TetR/AcrR family transcriptional regulator [Candidatus Rhodoblastus alkanivorans]MCI4684101.1 TetR/AcrR family transcriptional regulator [Candidatus Rhodoblastus alkanivorans]MDI4641421.1 TetR/AcrR family transcriptional regulator [Rhodoblastus acidophilus]
MPTRNGARRGIAGRTASVHRDTPDPENGRLRALVTIAEVFRRFGYEAATMSILSRETGLGRSSLYHYFPRGKQEMALAIFDLAEIFLRDDLVARLGGEGSLEQRIDRYVARLKEYYCDGAVGCVFASLTLHDCPPPVAARVSALMSVWIDELASRFAELGLPSARDLAARTIRNVQGGLVVALATRDRGQFDAAMADLREAVLNLRG